MIFKSTPYHIGIILHYTNHPSRSTASLVVSFPRYSVGVISVTILDGLFAKLLGGREFADELELRDAIGELDAREP